MTAPLANDATNRLAHFATECAYADLPSNVQEITRLLLIDTIGCALGGTKVDKGRIPIAVAKSFGASSDCTIIGDAGRSSVVGASFANGELFNALDMDAILVPGHISPYVIPPALAFAETRATDGKQLVLAAALAHEIGARVAAAGTPLRTLQGQPPNLTYKLSPATGYGSCIVGAAAGAGIVLGFDVDKMRSCYGVAGYMAPVPGLGKYLRLSTSPHVKYTSGGWVAAGGSTAALLVDAGYDGDPEVLDGEFGLCRMFASDKCDWETMLGGLGKRWRILESELKPYPSFRMGHPGIEAYLNVLKREAIDPAKIQSIEVKVDPISMSPLYLNLELKNHTDAQLSWPYVLAVAAYFPPGPKWQSAEAMKDPRVHQLMRKVKVAPQTAWAGELYDQAKGSHDFIATPFSIPVDVTVVTNGRSYAAERLPYPNGHPERPLDRKQVGAKFLENAAISIDASQAKRLLDGLLNVESYSDVRPLIALCGRKA